MKRSFTSLISILLFSAFLCEKVTIAEAGQIRSGSKGNVDLGVPQRVISTAPSITEILFALGQGDKVVGVTTFCDYPPEARTKPKIGGFASHSLEAVLQQRPDLVILVQGRTNLTEKLKAFEIPTLQVKSRGLQEIYKNIQLVAERLGVQAEGQRLVSSIRRGLKAFGDSLSERPRSRVLFLVGRTPGQLTDFHTVGKQSYINELIELAGGSNIFVDSPAPYPKVSLEEVLARNPEIIIDMTHGETLPESEIESIKNLWAKFPALDAVRNQRVNVIRQDLFVVPGPRVVEAVKSLFQMLHGEKLK